MTHADLGAEQSTGAKVSLVVFGFIEGQRLLVGVQAHTGKVLLQPQAQEALHHTLPCVVAQDVGPSALQCHSQIGQPTNPCFAGRASLTLQQSLQALSDWALILGTAAAGPQHQATLKGGQIHCAHHY